MTLKFQISLDMIFGAMRQIGSTMTPGVPGHTHILFPLLYHPPTHTFTDREKGSVNSLSRSHKCTNERETETENVCVSVCV